MHVPTSKASCAMRDPEPDKHSMRLRACPGAQIRNPVPTPRA